MASAVVATSDILLVPHNNVRDAIPGIPGIPGSPSKPPYSQVSTPVITPKRKTLRNWLSSLTAGNGRKLSDPDRQVCKFSEPEVQQLHPADPVSIFTTAQSATSRLDNDNKEQIP